MNREEFEEADEILTVKSKNHVTIQVFFKRPILQATLFAPSTTGVKISIDTAYNPHFQDPEYGSKLSVKTFDYDEPTYT